MSVYFPFLFIYFCRNKRPRRNQRLPRNKRLPKIVIFQRGSTQNRRVLECFFSASKKLSARGVYFGKYGIYFCQFISCLIALFCWFPVRVQGLIYYTVHPVHTQSPRHASPPPPSHGLISFLIIQNGAKTIRNLKTSTIQWKNWFWNGIRLIEWLGAFFSIDWLIDA